MSETKNTKAAQGNAKNPKAAKTAQGDKPAKTKRTKKETAPLETDAVRDAPLLETSVTQETPLLEAPTSQNAPLLDAPAATGETNTADAAPLGTLSASIEPDGGADLASAPAPKLEALRLPKGAFLAFRKSGGLHFSSREVVLYPDGRAAYDARGVPQKEYNRLRRVLNDGQMLALRKLLDQTNFWKTESAGQQNPDAFAYEITARLGQRANEIEVFDGSVPEHLTPLLERLVPLLPQE